MLMSSKCVLNVQERTLTEVEVNEKSTGYQQLVQDTKQYVLCPI